ncbi:MAG: ATP-dependent sacrificial sulfur transferase LarE [Sulfolobales archaeon]
MLTDLNALLSRLDDSLRGKFLGLVRWFKSVEGVIIVAFSGGVDSSVVLATATLAIGSENIVAVTAISPIRFEEDVQWAKTIATFLNVKHLLIESDELKDPNFIANPPNRCYFCKKLLAWKLLDIAEKYGAKVIVDGTNTSDLSDFRPGYLAFREAGIRSPLLELGFTKDEVRTVAKAFELPNWGEEPRTCLATRIPYGDLLSVERLRRIKEAERLVREITGLTVVRVRDHTDIARIEVRRQEMYKFFNDDVVDKVDNALRKLGYKYVTLDLRGYRSGSLNEVLPRELKDRYVLQR